MKSTTMKKKSPKAKIGDDVLALDSEKTSTFEKALKTAKSAKAKKEAEAAENAGQLKSGIIMLEHIPFGFFEKELKAFFSQFGKVLRVRVARSEKTGKSRGYAYIEFEFEDVAKIAAESMDGYLMFERLMKCKVLPSDVNTYKIFSKSYIRENKYPKLKSRQLVKKQQQAKPSVKESREILSGRLRKLEEQNKKFAEMGIDYQFDAGDIELPELEEELVDIEMKDQKTPTPKKSIKKTSISAAETELTETTPKSLKKSPKPKKMEESPAAAVVPQGKFPKFSPKLLRSRKSDISSLTVAALSSKKAAAANKKASISNSSPISPQSKSPKTPKSKKGASASTSAPGSASEQQQQDTKKSPKFPKFSPKLLRSRKSDASGLQNQNKTPEGQNKSQKVKTRQTPAPSSEQQEAKKSPKFPKFSPKLLRSRKSDVSGLQKKSPEGQKNKSKTPGGTGRKSVR